MIVHQSDLRRGNAGILELEGGALLAAEDNDILAFDTDGAGSCGEQTLAIGIFTDGQLAQGKCGLTSLHGLHGIFNLEDVPVRAEPGLATFRRAGVRCAWTIPENWDELASPVTERARQQRELANGGASWLT